MRLALILAGLIVALPRPAFALGYGSIRAIRSWSADDLALLALPTWLLFLLLFKWKGTDLPDGPVNHKLVLKRLGQLVAGSVVPVTLVRSFAPWWGYAIFVAILVVLGVITLAGWWNGLEALKNHLRRVWRPGTAPAIPTPTPPGQTTPAAAPAAPGQAAAYQPPSGAVEFKYRDLAGHERTVHGAAPNNPPGLMTFTHGETNLVLTVDWRVPVNQPGFVVRVRTLEQFHAEQAMQAAHSHQPNTGAAQAMPQTATGQPTIRCPACKTVSVSDFCVNCGKPRLAAKVPQRRYDPNRRDH